MIIQIEKFLRENLNFFDPKFTHEAQIFPQNFSSFRVTSNASFSRFKCEIIDMLTGGIHA